MGISDNIDGLDRLRDDLRGLADKLEESNQDAADLEAIWEAAQIVDRVMDQLSEAVPLIDELEAKISSIREKYEEKNVL